MRPFYTVALLLLSSACGFTLQPRAAYNPLALPANTSPQFKDFSFRDDKRTREIPLRIYLSDKLASEANRPAPVVLFSHGLGGTREGCAYLGKHWAARGYVAVFLQHPGSDDSVWKDTPVVQRMAAMQKAAGVENFRQRVQDVPATLDQLETWNKTTGHLLFGRLDLKRVGMSGHSFGAVTTQAVSGQSFFGRALFTDPRIKAAIAMSPSAPRGGGDPKQAFGSVQIPWMLLTGTHDTAPIGETDVKSRLRVFPALPPESKYELVLDKAEHSAFTDRALPGDAETRNPNHHRAILAVTTAFWDACLRKDAAARKWLNGDGVKKVLAKQDRWQHK